MKCKVVKMTNARTNELCGFVIVDEKGRSNLVCYRTPAEAIEDALKLGYEVEF
ncbi:hypothetical protein [Treponema succinifaciens]|uniref:hypothetical protein n=1 Tax=Treponema succinifaciens TaxID=167 RepID=UPI003FF0340D